MAKEQFRSERGQGRGLRQPLTISQNLQCQKYCIGWISNPQCDAGLSQRNDALLSQILLSLATLLTVQQSIIIIAALPCSSSIMLCGQRTNISSCHWRRNLILNLCLTFHQYINNTKISAFELRFMTCSYVAQLFLVIIWLAFTMSLILLLCNGDRKSTRLNSSHYGLSRMPSSA